MTDELANHYLIVHCRLDEFAKTLLDRPYNKKLKQVAKELSIIFRYKWEEEKAKASMEFWHENKRKAILKLRDETLGRKKKKGNNK